MWHQGCHCTCKTRQRLQQAIVTWGQVHLHVRSFHSSTQHVHTTAVRHQAAENASGAANRYQQEVATPAGHNGRPGVAAAAAEQRTPHRRRTAGRRQAATVGEAQERHAHAAPQPQQQQQRPQGQRQYQPQVQQRTPEAAPVPVDVSVLHPAQLTSCIMQCSTTEQLSSLVHAAHTRMDAVHLVAALHRVAAMSTGSTRPRRQPLNARRHAPSFTSASSQHSRATVHQGSSKDGQVATLAVARAATAQPGQISSLSAVEPGPQLTSVELLPLAAPEGNKLLHLAMSGTQKGQAPAADSKLLAGQLLHLLLPQLQLLRWRELSSILWSLATLQLLPIQHTGQAVVPLLLGHMEARGFIDADPQALSNTVWALARLQVLPDTRWMRSCMQAIIQSLSVMDAQHISTILWSLAALNIKPPPAWLQLYLRRVHKAMPDKQQQRALYPKSLMTSTDQQQHGLQAVAAARRRIARTQFTEMQQFSNTLYAVACFKANTPNDSWMLRFWGNTARIMQLALALQPKTQTSSAAVSPVARMAQHRTQQPHMQQASAGRVESQMQPRRSQVLSRHCVMLLWACSRMRLHPPAKWIQAIEALIQQQMPLMSAQELANVVYAYGRWAPHVQHRPSPALLAALCSWAFKRRGTMTAQGSANILWALAKLHMYPSPVAQMKHKKGRSLRITQAQNNATWMWGRERQRALVPVSTTSRVGGSSRSSKIEGFLRHALPGGVDGRWVQQLLMATVFMPGRAARTSLSTAGQVQTNKGQDVQARAFQQPHGSGKQAGMSSPKDVAAQPSSVRRVGVHHMHQQAMGALDAHQQPQGFSKESANTRLSAMQVHGGVTPQTIGIILWAAGVLRLDPGREIVEYLLAVVAAGDPNRWLPSRPARKQLESGCVQLGYVKELQHALRQLGARHNSSKQ